ncbi:MAG TPA: DUF692 family protein [Anaerolineae bacterium]|nr:DUF692 family protein [Anaerolineae bacterium]
MNFAINYSPTAAELVRSGDISLDLFKCPARPELIEEVQAEFPLYVHFPLRVGLGHGDATDKSGHPPDWSQIEALLRQTGTSFVNVHLNQETENFPRIPATTSDPGHIEFLTECALRDLQPLVERYGAERVIVENVSFWPGETLAPVVQPNLIRQVVEETGCGFLLDVSHARIAAHALEVEAWDYIQALPLNRTGEIHITGLQTADTPVLSKLRTGGLAEADIAQLAGQKIGHVPLTDQDWSFFAEVMALVRRGECGRPQVVTFEFGGSGSRWAALMDREALARQAPRLYALVKAEDRV